VLMHRDRPQLPDAEEHHALVGVVGGPKNACIHAGGHVVDGVGNHRVDQVRHPGRPVHQHASEVAKQRLGLVRGAKKLQGVRGSGRHRLVLVGTDDGGDVLVAGPAKAVLGSEVVDHQGRGDPRLGCDRPHTGACVPAFAEQFHGGVSNAGSGGEIRLGLPLHRFD
jgi:hypothetical protein